MTARWFIIRTRAGREPHVSLDIQCAGHVAWCPQEARRYRTAADRHRHRCSWRYVPVLPRHVLVAMDDDTPASVGHCMVQRLLDMRDVEAVLRDADGWEIMIPNAQVDRFRREVEAHNAHVLQSATYRPKVKPRWQALDAASLKQTLDEIYGVGMA